MKSQTSEFEENDNCPRCGEKSCNHWTPREPVMPSYLRGKEEAPKDGVDVSKAKKNLGI
jgi:hypothetical protein